MMHNLCKYLLLLAICLQACRDKDDEGEELPPCGDSLMAHPVYIQDTVQMKIGNELITQPNFQSRYRFQSWSTDSITVAGIDVYWGKHFVPVDTEITIKLYLGKRLSYGDTITSHELYDFLVPHVFERPASINYNEQYSFRIEFPFVSGQQPRVHQTSNEDYGNYFEITSRSPMYEHNGGYLAARITGAFCCTVHNPYNHTSTTLQGNFSGVARLE